MSEPNMHRTSTPSIDTETHDRGVNQLKAILGDILDIMNNSDIFPQTGKDAPSRFWSAYERMAKEHDGEFLERHNGNMDVLLIFAGLFSAVSSAFIVNMESNLSPNPSDTTNALLKILINKVDNGTFTNASLPVFNGPSSTIIWIQTLAYASLSTSLLAAFGAVLGKQWLGHFKTSRFGRGSLHERCKRRQQKLDGMETWRFSTIIATLPIFLQLSLLFFGIALAANIWILQHTIASVIMATTAFGAIFYFFTVVASLKFPDCPFQTPVSTVIERSIREAVSFRKTIRKEGEEHPQSWAGVLDRMLVSMEKSSKTFQNVVTRYVSRAMAYISRIPSALMRRIRLLTNDHGSTRSWPLSEVVEVLDLSCLDSPVDLAEPRAIQWIIETSTDTDVITAAVMMVPEVEWPDEDDVVMVTNRLKSHFNACFDPTWQVNFSTKSRAAACLKAMCHVDRAIDASIRLRYHGVYLDGQTYDLPRDQGFLLVSCALVEPNELDITSLPPSDRMWLAFMFTYRLYDGDDSPRFLNFLPEFIDKCLHDRKSTPPRLVADCLLLSSLMIGLRPDRRYLARSDKSAAITGLQNSVIDRMLGLLLGEPSLTQLDFPRNARKLLQPLANSHESGSQPKHDVSMRWMRFCFRSLENESPDTDGADVRFKDIAATIRHILISSPIRENYWIWLFMHEVGPTEEMYWMGRPNGYTSDQYDLLVDYLLRVCEGTNYETIGDTFVVLAGLRASPTNLEKRRRYIKAIVKCMGEDLPIYVRHAAMCAAYAVRTDVASLGRNDADFRKLFSPTLASAKSARGVCTNQQTSGSLDDKPFYEHSLYVLRRDLCYLGLLCALAQEPIWHEDLVGNDHITTCLEIADTLTSWTSDFNLYAVHISHIFAILDAIGDHEAQPIFCKVKTYPIWPLIMRGWRYIFSFSIFIEETAEGWQELSSKEYIEALSSTVAYARRHWREWEDTPEADKLIRLVALVSGKLDEEKRRRDQGAIPLGHRRDGRFENQGIPKLSNEIRSLLE